MKNKKIENGNHYRNETTSTFAMRLSDKIAASKLSIKELSEKIKVPSGSLSKYQNDNAEAGISSLVKIAKYFNVSTDYLLGIVNQKSQDLLFKKD